MDPLALNVLLKRLEDRASEAAMLREQFGNIEHDLNNANALIAVLQRKIKRLEGETNGTDKNRVANLDTADAAD